VRRSGSLPPSRDDARAIFATSDTSLLELIDNLLTKGVVLTGDVVLGLAGVDLVYARLSVLLCAADRVLDPSDDAVAPRAAP
jgi:gas vesicle protein GvpA/GvpJ/GvpM family